MCHLSDQVTFNKKNMSAYSHWKEDPSNYNNIL